MTDQDQSRAEFEKHVLAPNGFDENGAGWVIRNADGTYRHENIQARWMTWQAARATTEQSSGVELPEPVAFALEWTFNGEERGMRLYDDETHCRFDAESDGGICHPLYTEQQVRELLAAAPSLPQGWLPIESAPRDKTILLGYRNSHGHWRTLRGDWFSREEIDEMWEEPDGVEPGWFETSVEADDVPNVWRTNPTHWMSLPQPPKEQA